MARRRRRSRTKTTTTPKSSSAPGGVRRTRAGSKRARTGSGSGDAAALKAALRQARLTAGLSQAEAARRIGIHPVTLYVWENATRADLPRDSNLKRAARVYGTSPAALRGSANAPTDGVAAAPVVKRRRGRPPRIQTADHSGAAPASRALVRLSGSAAGHSPVGVDVPRSVYGRIFRALADLADNSTLGIDELASAQQALTSPALLGTFAALSDKPMSESDMLAAIDASASAVRAFVASRGKR